MRIAALLLAAASLGGCAYNGLGLGVGYGGGYGPYGYGYSPYGYGGSGISYSVGYGSRYGGYPYGYGGYGGYPYGYGGYGGYGSPYWGWYDGFYYPGTGYYVYDRYRNRQVWTDAQKRYWTERLQRAQSTNGVTKLPNNRIGREVWADFNRQQQTTGVTSQGVTRAQRAPRSFSTSSSRSERFQQRDDRRAERRSERASAASERRRNRDN